MFSPQKVALQHINATFKSNSELTPDDAVPDDISGMLLRLSDEMPLQGRTAVGTPRRRDITFMNLDLREDFNHSVFQLWAQIVLLIDGAVRQLAQLAFLA